MARHHVDADEAFAMLVCASQDTNSKLHDVARWLITDAATSEKEQPPRTEQSRA